MKNSLLPPLTGTYICGSIFLALSLVIFLCTSATDEEIWVLNYVLFIIYFMVVAANNSSEYGKWSQFRNIGHNILLLLLGNISAYTLNRTVPVFAESCTWLTIFLTILSAALLLFSIKKWELPEPLQYILMVIFGSGIVFSVYQVVYVAPVMLIGVLAFWLIGISMHIFVPLWFLILLSKITMRGIRQYPQQRFALGAGILIPITMCIVIALKYSNMQSRLTNMWRETLEPRAQNELPVWAKIGQRIPHDWSTDMVLKSNWYYTTDGMASLGRINDIEKRHNPFVKIASIGSNPFRVTRADKIKIYTALTNERHAQQPRLWSGNDLVTKDIATNIQVLPTYRLAYTEKTFVIKNKNTWKRSTQEALYTFYLPEGAVVTSASLWINGEESPAYLTTRQKADSAYSTIVGRERRDPLLVHWQEGQQITARIFPCTPTEDRTFKIGFTTPLRLNNNQLIYENIDFQGPLWKRATEDINIVIEGAEVSPKCDLNLQARNGGWSYRGKYKSKWEMRFNAVPLAKNAFVFNDRAFWMEEHVREYGQFDPEYIYLDINESWDRRTFNRIWKQVNNKKVYVYVNRMIEMTENNRVALFKQLQDWRFSLFPFHLIKKPEQSLVISKSNGISPTIDDLRPRKYASAKDEGTFGKNLKEYLAQNNHTLRVLHLGYQLSPYLGSLSELGAIHLVKEQTSFIQEVIQNGVFPKSPVSDKVVHLAHSNVLIREVSTHHKASKAPDHLLRLFAYNQLMHKIGKHYFDRKQYENILIEEAQEAHVLSPISSLVTLETEEDYERFDIKQPKEQQAKKKKKNSLSNANFNSAGEVPEPHEWAMVILGILMAIVLVLKRMKVLSHRKIKARKTGLQNNT